MSKQGITPKTTAFAVYPLENRPMNLANKHYYCEYCSLGKLADQLKQKLATNPINEFGKPKPTC